MCERERMRADACPRMYVCNDGTRASFRGTRTRGKIRDVRWLRVRKISLDESIPDQSKATDIYLLSVHKCEFVWITEPRRIV